MKFSWKMFYDKIEKDDILTQAAALAFYMGSAIVPLFVLLVSSIAILQYDQTDQLLDKIEIFVGAEAAQMFSAVSEGAKARTDLSSRGGAIALVILIISTSVIFSQIESAFDVIFKKFRLPANEQGFLKSFVKKKILASGMILSFILLTLLSVSLSVAFKYILTDKVWIFRVLNSVTDIVIFTFLFALGLKTLVKVPIEFKKCLGVGFGIALLFAFGKGAISLYLKSSATTSAYGAAGFPIALFFWLYYTALILLVGAETLSVMMEKKNEAV